MDNVILGFSGLAGRGGFILAKKVEKRNSVLPNLMLKNNVDDY